MAATGGGRQPRKPLKDSDLGPGRVSVLVVFHLIRSRRRRDALEQQPERPVVLLSTSERLDLADVLRDVLPSNLRDPGNSPAPALCRIDLPSHLLDREDRLLGRLQQMALCDHLAPDAGSWGRAFVEPGRRTRVSRPPDVGGRSHLQSDTSPLRKCWRVGGDNGEAMMRDSNDFVDVLIGMLSQISGLRSIRLASVDRAPRLQRRVETDSSTDLLIAQAREIALHDGAPFWHALFRLGGELPSGVPASVVAAAAFHQDVVSEPDDHLQVAEGFANQLRRRLEQGDEKTMVMLTSELGMSDGSVRHLPMLDFSVKEVRRGAEASVRRIIEELGEPGLLVASGRSFHFFGARALTESSFREFLARALLFTPLTDERWIAHQLVGDMASLRISMSDKQLTPVPIGSVVPAAGRDRRS